MASLQARHSRRCASGKPWTPYHSIPATCTCKPVFHITYSEAGRVIREPMGCDLRLALDELALVDQRTRKQRQERLRRIEAAREARSRYNVATLDKAYVELRRLLDLMKDVRPLTRQGRHHYGEAHTHLYRAEEELKKALKCE